MATPAYVQRPSNLTYFTKSHRFPILFYKPVTTLIGPLATIVIPKAAQPPKDHLPDYEVELVIVIGKAAKDVSEADALDYVLGYTGANDVRASNLSRFASE
jgi:2-keto-4-pentenoate hydratase/2-oxohepta-3-ene-1,7-dioic acid hydratase in catechol pathway